MISRILHEGLLIVTAVLGLGLAAWGQCSNANVTGKYGFASGGLDKNGKPISVLGYIKANGKGTFTGTETGSDDGTVFTNVPIAGTYSINSDCTGSGTSKLTGQKMTNHFTLVVVSGGKNLQTLSTDAPNVQTGTVQAHRIAEDEADARVDHAAVAISIELVREWPLDLGAGRHGLRENGVHVLDVEQDADG